MRIFYKISLRFRSLFRKGRVEQELTEELRFHVEKLTEEYIARGRTAQEARHAALRQFGGVEQVKEECRDSWGIRFIETLLQDLRFSLRMLRKNPGFTAVAIVTLALGIGANTTIFSLLNGLLFRDLPVRHPEQLVEISIPDRNGQNQGLSLPMFEEIERRQRVFSGMFSWWFDPIFSVEVNEILTRGDISAVAGNFYSELSVRPVLGRAIEPADVNLDGGSPANVAVLGYGFWQRYFGGNPAAIGKTVRVEGLPFTIIGVAPRGFTGMGLPVEPDVTIPVTAAHLITSQPVERLYSRDHFWLNVTGRLKDGFTEAQARAEMEVLWRGVLEATLPAKYDAQQRAAYLATPLAVASAAKGVDWYLRGRFTRPLVVVMAIAGLLLLIACVNLATLMLARAAARSHEMGLRVALGASRWRLARQLLTESTLLSGAGGVAGLAIANWSSLALRSLMLGISIVPPALNVSPDLHVLAFTAVAAIATGILFGLAPVWQITRQDPARAIQQGSRTMGTATGRFGKALISMQAALSLVLLMGAGLFVRSLQLLRSFNPGFRREGILTAGLWPRPNGFTNTDSLVYYSELIRRVRGLPGVLAASLSNFTPLAEPESQENVSAAVRPAEVRQAYFGMVSPGFFETLGIGPLRGRDFNWQDKEHAPRVAILSRRLAEELFPAGDAIGQHINITPDLDWKNVEVVGIVSDARLFDVRSPNASAVYVNVLQEGEYAQWGVLEVRSAGDPMVIATTVRQAVNSLGWQYVWVARTPAQVDDEAFLNERIIAMLSGFFGGLALLLVGTGLYGLMAYTVTRRAREIGIRMALGAERRSVLWMVMRESLALVMVGVAIGLPTALAATRLISSMLFGMSPADPTTILLATLALGGVAAFASYLPAQRATKVDPMVALRYE